MNKTKVKTAALPAAGLPLRFWLAAAALILALLAIPQIGHAQGIVRGAQEGSYEGNRIAGPVGGVVGGAVGAGVGGAMGAVKGVFVQTLGLQMGATARLSCDRAHRLGVTFDPAVTTVTDWRGSDAKRGCRPLISMMNF